MSKWYSALALLLPGGLLAQAEPTDEALALWEQEHLVRYCGSYLEDPQSTEGSLCRGFLLGFVAGAEAVQQSIAPSTEGESFGERATRTRAGSWLERRRLEALPWFCLNADATLGEIAAAVIARFDADSAGNDAGLMAALLRALAESLPCDPD